MVNIPNFSRTETVTLMSDLGPVDVEINEYRPADMKYITQIQNLQSSIPELVMKGNAIRTLMEGIKEEVGEAPEPGTISEKEAANILTKATSNMDESDLSEEDILQLTEVTKELQAKEGELMEITSKLGQRGLKRFYYKDEPEYREAERNNEGTKYIDSLPFIPCPVEDLKQIAFTMMRLGEPSLKLRKRLERKAAGKGK